MASQSSKSRNVGKAIPEDRIAEVEAVSRKVFGKVPLRVAFPGGKSRAAFVADMDGLVCVFAKREDEASAMLEAQVLKAFAGTGNAPAFIARHENWLVQECVPGTRLPILIDAAKSMREREALIADSLEALLRLHDAAHENGLQHRIQKVGATDEWLDKQITHGDRMADKLGIEAPVFDRQMVRRMLKVRHTDFVKRDARPGNAMVLDGRFLWFDFEDCGRRRKLDDLIWVICDEWTAVDSATEERLTEQFFQRFRGGVPEAEARRYFHIYGQMHMMWRLRLIVRYQQRDLEWWDREMCLQKDKIGITPIEAARLCERGIRWAAKQHEMAELGNWYRSVARRLELPSPRSLYESIAA